MWLYGRFPLQYVWHRLWISAFPFTWGITQRGWRGPYLAALCLRHLKWFMEEKRLEYSERASQRGHVEGSLGNKRKVNNEVDLSDSGKWIRSKMDNWMVTDDAFISNFLKGFYLRWILYFCVAGILQIEDLETRLEIYLKHKGDGFLGCKQLIFSPVIRH